MNQTKDAGLYECIVRNAANDSNSATFELWVTSKSFKYHIFTYSNCAWFQNVFLKCRLIAIKVNFIWFLFCITILFTLDSTPLSKKEKKERKRIKFSNKLRAPTISSRTGKVGSDGGRLELECFVSKIKSSVKMTWTLPNDNLAMQVWFHKIGFQMKSNSS